MEKNIGFLFVDDNYLSCFVAERLMKAMRMEHAVKTFLDPDVALAYISEHYADFDKTVLMVDLKMPTMDGFEFVEAFEKLPSAIKSRFSVYILTSSINSTDRETSFNYKSIQKFLSKPLTLPVIESVINTQAVFV